LLKLVNDIFGVNTIEKKEMWISSLKMWNDKYSTFLKKKSYIKNAEKYQRKWWYTHRNIRSCFAQLCKLVNDDNLFSYLRTSAFKVPNTSNTIEGGINKEIKRLIRSHSGLSQFHAMKLVEIFLYLKSEFGSKIR
jgi:hypothetical protein